MSIESVMLSNHLILILCCPLLLLPSIFPSIRIFSNEPALCIRWLKYWSFSFSNSPSNKYSGLIYFLGWLVWSPCSPRDSPKSSPASQFESINSLTLNLLYDPILTSIHDYWKNKCEALGPYNNSKKITFYLGIYMEKMKILIWRYMHPYVHSSIIYNSQDRKQLNVHQQMNRGRRCGAYIQ